jgi:branched-chain amino acid transport system substrate-binding protein
MRTPVRQLILGLALLLSAVFLVAACGGDGEEAQAPVEPAATGAATGAVPGEEPAAPAGEPTGEPIIIGEATAATGVLAYLDNPSHTGMEIAVDEINAAGGVLGRPLKIERKDYKSDPQEGAKVALELLDDGAELIVVTCDFDFGGPAAREAEKQGKISFSNCAASTKFGPVGVGPHSFTMSTSAPTQGAIHAEHAVESGWTKAYVLLDTSIDFNKQVCAGFETRYRELKGEIVGKDTFLQQDASIASQVTRLKSVSPQPDALMLCTYQPGLAQAVRQIRAAGIDLPVMVGDDGDGYFWHETVPNISNVFFTSYASIAGDNPDAAVNEFFEAFDARAGSPAPTSHALTGYGVVQAYARAVEKAGTTDADAVQAALESFKDEPLLIGPTTFTKEFHLQLYRPMALVEIVGPQNDRLVKMWRPESVPLPKT